MGTLGLETVLISDVVDGVNLAIITGVRVWTLNGDSFLFGAQVLDFAGFFWSDAVAGFLAAISKTKVLLFIVLFKSRV